MGQAQTILDPKWKTLPQSLPTYNSYAIGKWHMTGWNPSAGLAAAGYSPIDFGFRTYRGARGNIGLSHMDWTLWEQVGQTEPTSTENFTTYTLEYEVSQAISLVNGGATEPWFIYLALHAVHTPWTVPDPDWHSNAATKAGYIMGDDGGSDTDVALAIIESMDTKIGELMAAVNLNDTVVIFVGDNGSATNIPANPDNSGLKASIQEGGINVPLIIAGAGVSSGAVTTALAHGTDLFPTIVELTGHPAVGGIDGVSLVPVLETPASTVRTNLYQDGAFVTTAPSTAPLRAHDAIVRNSTHKMIRQECSGLDRTYELYNLIDDNPETTDLIDSAEADDIAAKAALLAAFDSETGDATPCRPTFYGVSYGN